MYAIRSYYAGVPHAWTWLFAPVLVLGLAILFRVRRQDLVWPLLGGLTVWLGVELGSGLGYWQGWPAKDQIEFINRLEEKINH